MKNIKKKLKALIAQSLNDHEETQALLKIHADALQISKDIDFLVDLNRQFDFAIDHPGKNTFNGEAQRYVARKDSGAFYTPDDIVKFLAQSCIIDPLNAYPPKESFRRLKNLKILDPAMGTGAFLIRALECMVHTGRRLSIIIKHQNITSAFLHRIYNYNITTLHSKFTNGVKRKRQSLQNISNCLLRHCAMHCIYGIDKNNRAVQIVRQTFKHIAGTQSELFLDHFACGDAIASPLFCHISIPEVCTKEQQNDYIKDWYIQNHWTILPIDLDQQGRFSPFMIENVFQDVFTSSNGGFDIILMNPPWNKLILNRRAWYRSYLEESKCKNRFERAEAVKMIEAELEPKWLQFEHENSELRKRIIQTSARKICGLDVQISGHIDAYAMFLERAWLLTKNGGYIGAVLPNAFYANNGPSIERILMFEHSTPHYLFGFNNSKKIFKDVASGMRFCLLKTEKSHCSEGHIVETGFGYNSVKDLKSVRKHHQTLNAPVETSLGKNGSIVAEISNHTMASYLSQLNKAETFGDYMDRCQISLGQEINVTNCADYIVDATLYCPPHTDARMNPLSAELAAQGFVVLHEKGSFAAYHSDIKENVRFLFNYQQYQNDKKSLKRLSGMSSFRIACRSTIHAAEREKSVFALLPPGCVVANSALVETHPERRELKYALALLAVANTQLLNTIAQQYINTNLKLFLIKQLPFPNLDETDIDQLAVSALQLCAPASLYHPLFEQFHTKPLTDINEQNSMRHHIETLVRTRFGLDRI